MYIYYFYIRNINIENVYLKDNDSIIKSSNKYIDGVYISCELFNVKNVLQSNVEYNSLLVNIDGGKVKFDK